MEKSSKAATVPEDSTLSPSELSNEGGSIGSAISRARTRVGKTAKNLDAGVLGLRPGSALYFCV